MANKKAPPSVITSIQFEIREKKAKYFEAVTAVRQAEVAFNQAKLIKAARAQDLKELATFLDDNMKEEGGYVDLVGVWMEDAAEHAERALAEREVKGNE